MKAYLIIYPGDGAEHIRNGMEKFRLAEHISEHASIVITFYNEEEILNELNEANPFKSPIFVTHFPGGMHTINVPKSYFEPTSSDKI